MRLATRDRGSALRPTRLRFARARANIPGPVTFPTTDLKVTVRIALGADLSQPWYTWSWLDITERVRYRDAITITAGRRDWSSRTDTSIARLRIDNSDGYFSRRNPNSPYYGLLTRQTPIWITVDPGSGESTRYQGYVTEWPTRWTDKSGVDSTVPIVCAGVIRRLEKSSASRSAMYRTIAGVAPGDYVPRAYWPCEDGSSATRLASAIADITAMTFTSGVTPAGNSALVGSSPLPTFTAGASATAIVPPYTDTGQWIVQFAINITAEPSSTTTYAEILAVGGAVARWTLEVAPGSPATVWIRGYDSAGALFTENGEVLDGAPWSESAFFGQWFMVTIGCEASGSNFTLWNVLTDSDGDYSLLLALDLLFAGAPGTVRTIRPVAGEAMAAGHIAVFTDPNFAVLSDALNNTSSMAGWVGEQAHARFARVCREESIAYFTAAGQSVAMGPQPVGTAVEVARDCAKADQGFLYERDFGLGYQALSERLNATVSLSLDFDQRHIAEEPEPADDDQRTVNRWTSSRSGGSSATVEADDLADADPLYEGSDTVNVEADSQLADDAGMRVHLGTVDEDRWPRIAMRMRTTPGLISQWVAVPAGARMNLANPPDQVAPDTIDAVIEGHAERIDPKRWDVTLNTSPALPYQTGVYAEPTGDTSPLVGWYESDSCVLAAGVDSSATSWQITSVPVWSTTADDFPVDVRVGGEVVTVTACSGASAPQTWTVTRSVNTVAKSHSANAAIKLVHPLIYVP